jgi:serine/threonine protein kinase
MQVASALEHAHSRGLVHRDIKPANLLLHHSTGQALIADFGLALNAADRGPDSPAAGTTPYMSPEQATDEVQVLDGRSDLFSLGIVFYELLTGRRPFEGRTRSELLDQIRHAEPLPPQALRPGIPEELGLICLKCLEKNPEDRFQTSGQLAKALGDWLAVLNSSSAVVDCDDQWLPLGPRPFDPSDVETRRWPMAYYGSPSKCIDPGNPRFRHEMALDLGNPNHLRRRFPSPFDACAELWQTRPRPTRFERYVVDPSTGRRIPTRDPQGSRDPGWASGSSASW